MNFLEAFKSIDLLTLIIVIMIIVIVLLLFLNYRKLTQFGASTTCDCAIQNNQNKLPVIQNKPENKNEPFDDNNNDNNDNNNNDNNNDDNNNNNNNNNNNDNNNNNNDNNNQKYKFGVYYAMWCSHSKIFLKEYETNLKPALENDPKLKDTVIVVLNDCEKNKEVCQNIPGFPTLILHKPDGKNIEYSGARSTQDIIKFIKANM
jgi:hypothetical protein